MLELLELEKELTDQGIAKKTQHLGSILHVELDEKINAVEIALLADKSFYLVFQKLENDEQNLIKHFWTNEKKTVLELVKLHLENIG